MAKNVHLQILLKSIRAFELLSTAQATDIILKTVL